MAKVHKLKGSKGSADPFVQCVNRKISTAQYVKTIDVRVSARRAADARDQQQSSARQVIGVGPCSQPRGPRN
jgi:hypothetical protein